jgi:RHS repeat-associated protein
MKREGVLLGIIVLFILGLLIFSGETFALSSSSNLILDYQTQTTTKYYTPSIKNITPIKNLTLINTTIDNETSMNTTIPETNITNSSLPLLSPPLPPPPDLNDTNMTIPGLNDTNLTIPNLNETNITIPDLNETNITIPDLNDTNITIPELNETNITIPDLNETNITIPELNETNITIQNDSNESTAELVPSGEVLITTKVFIIANNVLVASKSSDAPTETQYYIQDHLGNNMLVLNRQVINEENKYYAFGETNSTGNSGNSYKYNGKELDKETELYYYGARYYEPELGRFIQADALTGSIENPLSMNRYSYVSNNPMKFVDPTGNAGQSAQNTVTAQQTPSQLSQWIKQADSAKQVEIHNADSTFTERVQSAVSHLYSDSVFTNILSKFSYGRRDFAKDFPKENKRGFDALQKGDSIFIDTPKVAQAEEFQLIAGHEDGHVVTDSTTTKQEQEQIWNTIDSLATSGDRVASNLKTYVVAANPKYSNSDLANEAISVINNVILSGNGDKLSPALRDLSNMDKANQNTRQAKKNIDSAKTEFYR